MSSICPYGMVACIGASHKVGIFHIHANILGLDPCKFFSICQLMIQLYYVRKGNISCVQALLDMEHIVLRGIVFHINVFHN